MARILRHRLAYLTGAVVLAVAMLGVVISQFVSVKVTTTRSLVGPEEPIYKLSIESAPLSDLKEAVRQSNEPVDEIRWRQSSILSRAVVRNRHDFAEWLLQEGADPNGLTPGTAPLKYAILQRDVEMIELLIKYGANPDLKLRDPDWTVRSLAEDDEELMQVIADAEREFSEGDPDPPGTP